MIDNRKEPGADTDPEADGIVNSFLGLHGTGNKDLPPQIDRRLFQEEEPKFPWWMTGLIILGVLVIALLMTNGWEISWLKI